MEDGIKLDLKDVEGSVDWIDLSRNVNKWPSLANTVIKVQLSYNAKNSLTS
jgi:predicted CoA-binding protein